MTQEEFKDILTPEFKGFTSRMWVDYLDETNGLLHKQMIMLGMSSTI